MGQNSMGHKIEVQSIERQNIMGYNTNKGHNTEKQ